MRVIVTGGRDLKKEDHVWDWLDKIHRLLGITELAQGQCPTGADLLAREWARMHNVPLAGFRADWDIHGKAAGPIRNQRMLAVFQPELVVAFPGGRGTMNTRGLAEHMGIPLLVIP